jgi:hypothetical protein
MIPTRVLTLLKWRKHPACDLSYPLAANPHNRRQAGSIPHENQSIFFSTRRKFSRCRSLEVSSSSFLIARVCARINHYLLRNARNRFFLVA